MSRNMEGKVIAITGAASGIGFATAKLLLERGARVSIADVSPDLETSAIELARGAGVEQSKAVHTQKVNVRDLAEVELWIKATIEKFGRLDGAVNAAGIYDYPAPRTLWHERRAIDSWHDVIGINLTGVANCLHAELELMTSAEAKAAGWGKSIVNLSSVAGLRTAGSSPSYVASKHGVLGLTKALAWEYGSAGVRINAVCPGIIATPMTDKLADSIGAEAKQQFINVVPMSRMAEPEDVAKTIAFLLSDESSYTTGAAHVVDGGLIV